MPIWIYLAAALGLTAMGFGSGWEVRAWKAGNDATAAVVAQEAAIKKAAEDARALGIAEGDITITAGRVAAEAQTKIVTRTITQIKEIPVYVSPKAVAACTVTAGTVRLLDNAASGADKSAAAVSQPAAESNDAPAGIGIDTVAANVVSNYGRCFQNANELTGLQKWIKDQQKLHEAKPK